MSSFFFYPIILLDINLNLFIMNILSYKPATKAVEVTPAVKKHAKAPVAPRLVFNPDGTVSPIEEHLNWDFDKLNSAGE